MIDLQGYGGRTGQIAQISEVMVGSQMHTIYKLQTAHG